MTPLEEALRARDVLWCKALLAEDARVIERVTGKFCALRDAAGAGGEPDLVDMIERDLRGTSTPEAT